MSNETQHTPADVRERVKGAWATVKAAALAQANVLDSHYGGQPSRAAEIRNAVEQVAALLRSPRGEGEAQPWRKVGEEPPPNGVQVLVYDPRPDGYSHAGCWAYTLIRKGDEYYLDGERCDEEDRSRLRIEEWLWQPLPPYPGSRSKDDGVRDAARRSDAQGEEDALVCASCGEPIGDEPTVIWQGAYTHYRCTPEDAIRDDTPVIRPIDTARRGEGGGK